MNIIIFGLRLVVFVILLVRYLVGLEFLEFVECLEEMFLGKFWEIFSLNGYIFKDLIKIGKFLFRSLLEF